MRIEAALSALCVSLLLPLVACAKVAVATTTGSLAGIVEAIGGENVEVTTLANPAEDPHYVDARPNLVVLLHSVDMLVSVGLELEVGWLPSLERAARNPRIAPGSVGRFDAAAAVPHLLDVSRGKVDRAEGDIHPGGNPHFLYDPRRAASVGFAIGQRLAALDPANAATYVTRAQTFADACAQVATRAAHRFAALRPEQRRVTTYHASWVYVLDWLGLTAAATVEPKPGIAPSPAHVAQVMQTMRAQGIKAILQEEFYPRGTSETLAKLTNARLVLLEGAARPGQPGAYLAHVERLSESIYAALAQ